jgi:hypothetical protein
MSGENVMSLARMSVQQKRIQKLESLVKDAIKAINKEAYTEYMHKLIALGKFIQDLSNHHIVLRDTDFPRGSAEFRGATTRSDQYIKNKTVFVAAVLRKLYGMPHNEDFKFKMPPETPGERRLTIQNNLAFRAFEAAWEDGYLREKSQRKLAAKADMNRTLRQQINLGQMVVANCTHMEFVKELNPATAVRYNKEATSAIKNFKTRTQKALNVVGKLFTVLVALTFGATTGSAILATFGTVLIFGSAYPIMVAAALVAIAGAITNYFIFNKPVFGFLNNIFGKDKWFEGLTHYVNEDGKKVQLSAGRKVALVFSFLLAASVGVSSSALVFTSIVGAGFFAATAASFLAPVIFSAIACICLTALMFGSFAFLLQQKSLKSIFTNPFKNVAKIFDPSAEENQKKSSTRLKLEKAITLGVVATLSLLAMFGLVVNSLASSISLNTFLTSGVLFSTTSYVASISVAVSYVVGMGIAFAGQIPFVLESAGRAVANIATMARNALAPKAKIASVLRSAPSSQQQPTKKPNGFVTVMLEAFKFANAIGNGVLVVPSLIKEFGSAIFAGVSGLASGGMSLCAGLASSSVPGEAEKMKARSSDYRIAQLLAQSSDSDIPRPVQRGVAQVDVRAAAERAVLDDRDAPASVKRSFQARKYSSIIFDRADVRLEGDKVRRRLEPELPDPEVDAEENGNGHDEDGGVALSPLPKAASH